jgi:hemerythrin-like domain-containing protein
MKRLDRGRREVLAGAMGAGMLFISSGAPAKDEKGGEIPPTEDLMREHGVLRRLLLVYDEAARRLAARDATDGTVTPVVAAGANIVRRFVEGYHEKLEEDFVFPKLEKAGKLVPLTSTLRAQHAAGRKLTDAILKATGSRPAGSAEGRGALVADLQSFGRMYAPHAAWEDTELFPVYRALFTEKELDVLGDRFEDQEHKLLGSGGFEGSLKEVGDLEKALGIHDLAKFTPRP